MQTERFRHPPERNQGESCIWIPGFWYTNEMVDAETCPELNADGGHSERAACELGKLSASVCKDDQGNRPS